MKDLKTILEVGRSKSTNETVSISLNKANVSNILFALAYVYKNDNEADKWKHAEHESLYLSLYKEAAKTFGKEELEDLGIEDNIEKIQIRY